MVLPMSSFDGTNGSFLMVREVSMMVMSGSPFTSFLRMYVRGGMFQDYFEIV